MNDTFEGRALEAPPLEARCDNCGQMVLLSRATCMDCAAWQPWGDQAVARARRERLAAFRRDELVKEREWENWRREQNAQAPRQAARWRFLRVLHELRCRPERAALATIAASTVLCGAAFSIGRAIPRYTPRPETRATAKCQDGTWSYAVNRAGACAGHGGVKTFYKGR